MWIPFDTIADLSLPAAWNPLLPKAGLLSDASNLYFFREIFSFLSDELDEFRDHLLGRSMAAAGGLALVLMTLWIFVQGYRIVTGRSREPMMQFVTQSLRATLIVSVATTFALGGTSLSRFLTDDLNRAVTKVVTGKDENAYDRIDRSLGYMQLAMSSIDALHTGEDPAVQGAKDRNLWFTGIGIAGPAITGGAMLLLNKIAMALIVGLGPLFVLCLLFDQTKQLFHRWLWYGIGTLFSLALLSVMVALALDAVLAVAAAFWTGKFFGASTEGINSLALQQGGLGLILTVLIVSAPPMAASFFQGTLGAFAPYMGSNDGGLAASRGQSRYQGHPGWGYPGQGGYPLAAASQPARETAPMSWFAGSYAAAAPQAQDDIKRQPGPPSAG
ncbi:type IV secretion system protein [Vulcaniibacterium gelatinicum]|uniref:type IV secretion system protein n=1 Tax=Vulcaniibacterium gelatinicum TaxID=2598725 RepID=UPI0011CA7A65|nr:type IV secretion system protein [Vulcaniibacterium gelatinicum]